MPRSCPLTRREFINRTGTMLAPFMLTWASSSAACAADSPARRLSAGPQLFLDDRLIAREQNLRRVIHSPERLPAPIVTADQDKCFQPYVSVLRDPESGRFRLWYNVAIDSANSHIGYLESDDGIQFIRPHRVLGDPSGLPVAFGAYVVDDGVHATHPSQRFKLAWEKNGLFTATSPDGLTWTATRATPVLDGIGDIIALSRDPIRNRYLLTCKLNSRPEDGYRGSTPNASEGTRRLVGQSTSEDCIHWSEPRRIIVPDEEDEGVTEFYSIGNVMARGGTLIGLLKVLRDDLSPEPGGEITGIGYTCLAWTHDGLTWHRDREPFMDRNPTPGAWDRAMTWGDCLLPVDEQVFIYYGGYARGHKVERFKERQIGLARMKQDRFVARTAGRDEGQLVTVPFVLDANELRINATVNGELRVAVVGESGSAIPGYGLEDCAALRGDSPSHVVRFKSPLAKLKGQPIRLEFSMREAELFAFELA